MLCYTVCATLRAILFCSVLPGPFSLVGEYTAVMSAKTKHRYEDKEYALVKHLDPVFVIARQTKNGYYLLGEEEAAAVRVDIFTVAVIYFLHRHRSDRPSDAKWHVPALPCPTPGPRKGWSGKDKTSVRKLMQACVLILSDVGAIGHCNGDFVYLSRGRCHPYAMDAAATECAIRQTTRHRIVVWWCGRTCV